jgi:hypothetical protein
MRGHRLTVSMTRDHINVGIMKRTSIGLACGWKGSAAAPAVVTRLLVVLFSRVLGATGSAGITTAQVLSPLPGLAADNSRGSQKGEEEPMPQSFQLDFATRLRLLPLEMLRLVIRGFDSYGTDTPDGGGDWGSVGEAPRGPQAVRRFSVMGKSQP